VNALLIKGGNKSKPLFILFSDTEGAAILDSNGKKSRNDIITTLRLPTTELYQKEQEVKAINSCSM
jgi:hypothetical protein